MISRDELVVLAGNREGPCVSLFMPAHRAVAEPREDPLRFKNLLASARDSLLAEGLRSPEVSVMLAAAQDLVSDGIFWKNQGDGLAMFLSPDLFKIYLLSYPVEELVCVSHAFCLRPLLPLLDVGGHFFVLALSGNDVRLLRGTRFQVVNLDTSSLPHSAEEALNYEAPERHLQFHTGTPQRKGGTGERAAIFHGHGGGKEDKKSNILKYFREVDRGLQETLSGERAPLVLAGVEYLFPIFREATTYPNVMDEGIPGNPEELSPLELHELAWGVVEPWFDSERQAAIERFQAFSGSGRATIEIGEIVPAAANGGVETLFVDLTTRVWGTYDPSSAVVELHKDKQPLDEDLLELAAANSFLTGARVYPGTAEDIPVGSPAAAILRY